MFTPMFRVSNSISRHILGRATFSSYGNVILSFKDVSFEYSQRKPLLENASFSISAGSKVTIMGQNGSGKSTILNLIQSKLLPESGSINISHGLRVAAAKQTFTPEENLLTVKEFFEKVAPHIQRNIEGDIYKALSHVNLIAPLDRLVNTFSGGQKARLLLASAIINDPDIILLDEPTNNLDTEGIDLLTEFILGTDKTVIVISHDEEFLNIFSDTVLYLDSFNKLIETHDGNYNDVKLQIEKKMKKDQQDNVRKAKLAQEKKEQANVFANKGGGMRKVAKKMRELADDLENDMVSVKKEDKHISNFEIPHQHVSGASLKLSSISVAGMFINSNTNRLIEIPLDTPLDIRAGTKLRIRGKNGIGKTTLLEKIVDGTLKGGNLAAGIRVGYYRQDFSTLNFNQTVIESLYEACNGNFPESDLKRISSQFLLNGNIMNQKIETLSEGQKGLCSFARLVVQEPGILIVDEPTNHINFRHIPLIANALNNYKGGLIMVSHDEKFISDVNITDELILDDEVDKFKVWLANSSKSKSDVELDSFGRR